MSSESLLLIAFIYALGTGWDWTDTAELFLFLKLESRYALPAFTEYGAYLFSLIFLALYLLAAPWVKAFVPFGVDSILVLEVDGFCRASLTTGASSSFIFGSKMCTPSFLKRSPSRISNAATLALPKIGFASSGSLYSFTWCYSFERTKPLGSGIVGSYFIFSFNSLSCLARVGSVTLSGFSYRRTLWPLDFAATLNHVIMFWNISP